MVPRDRQALAKGTAGRGMGAVTAVLGGSVLGAVGGFLIRIIHRFAVLRGFDKIAGIPLGAATAAITLYIAAAGGAGHPRLACAIRGMKFDVQSCLEDVVPGHVSPLADLVALFA